MCMYNHSSVSHVAKFKAHCLVIRKADEEIGKKLQKKSMNKQLLENIR